MENATYIGLSYQAGLERQLNVVANNVANVSTPGFKGRQVLFSQFLEDPKGEANPYYTSNDYGEYMDEASGSYSQSGRPLDVALEGPGYIGMITKDGVRYTRAGHFTLNSVGELVGPNGLRVADDGGSAITIPAGTKNIAIASDGTVSANDNPIGQIMIREFQNQQVLKPIGNTLFDSGSDQGAKPEKTAMRQGMLEGSNVNGVAEMSNMIEILRNYQSVQHMLQSESDRMRTSIERLSGRGG